MGRGLLEMFGFGLLLLHLLNVANVESEGISFYTLATFNADLVPGTEDLRYAERKAALLQEVRKSNADILCLQGLWLEQDISAVTDSASNFAYHHKLPVFTDAQGFDIQKRINGPCELLKLAALQACFSQSNCPTENVPLLDSVACSFVQCKSYALDLSQECINCFIAKISGGLSALLQCGTVFAVAYPSTHGLLLLSKLPLLNKFQSNFSNGELSLLTHGYIGAEVRGIGKVVCTQMTSYIPGVYVGPSSFSSYRQEQASQVDELLMTFPSSESKRTLILGEFGHGPTVGDSIIGIFSQQYERMIRGNYISPYASRNTGECTVCFANSLAGEARVLFTSVFSTVDLQNSTAVSLLKAKLAQNNVIDFNISYKLSQQNSLNFSDPSFYMQIQSRNTSRAAFVSNSYGFISDHIYVPESIETDVIQARRIWSSLIVNVSNTYVALSDHYGVEITINATEMSSSGAVGFYPSYSVSMAVSLITITFFMGFALLHI